MEPAMPTAVASSPRHCLDVGDLTDVEVDHIFQRARRFRELFERRGPRIALPPTLRGQAVATVFFEPSTRTRLSFELAAQRLQAVALPFDIERSSLRKSETLADTLRTLEAMGVTVAVLRHPDNDVFRALPPGLRLSLINAGNGTQAHPTQALLDTFTLSLRWPELTGKVVVIAGDVAHSRVARSSARLLLRLGARVLFTGPPCFLPASAASEIPGASCAPLEDALPRADALMCLRIQRERHVGEAAPGSDESDGYLARYGLTEARFHELKPSCLLLHPGPVNRDLEIASALVEHPRSLILEQVHSGVFVRMALLEWVTGVMP